MKSSILFMAFMIGQMLVYGQNSAFIAESLSAEENRLQNDRTDAQSINNQVLLKANLLAKTLEKPEVLKENEEDSKERYEFSNSNYFNYFMSPSGFNLPKKSFYFHNQGAVFINSLHYGFSNHFSMGMGLIFIPDLTYNFFVRPRLSFKLNDKFYLGTGATLIYLGPLLNLEDDLMTFLPISQLVLTYGNHDSNITLGASVVFSPDYRSYEERESFISLPVISLAGMHRFAKHFVLVSDNYFGKEFFSDDNLDYIGMHGFRIIGRKNSFDIGLGLYYRTYYDPYLDSDYNPMYDDVPQEHPYNTSDISLFPYIAYLRRF